MWLWNLSIELWERLSIYTQIHLFSHLPLGSFHTKILYRCIPAWNHPGHARRRQPSNRYHCKCSHDDFCKKPLYLSSDQISMELCSLRTFNKSFVVFNTRLCSFQRRLHCHSGLLLTVLNVRLEEEILSLRYRMRVQMLRSRSRADPWSSRSPISPSERGR
jgi:hypothetical protein